MAANVWSDLLKGVLAFAQSRAGALTQSTLKDAAGLVTALVTGAPAGVAKTRLDQLRVAIQASDPAVQSVVDAITPKAKAASDAAAQMAATIGSIPFALDTAAAAAGELATILTSLDDAIGIVATQVAAPDPAPAQPSMISQVRAIAEPWRVPFRGLAPNATQALDSLCSTVLGINQAGSRLQTDLVWDRVAKRVALKLQAAASRNIGPLAYDSASVEPFFAYADTPTLGISIRANLKTSLAGDAFLQAILPAQNATAQTSNTAITLDTQNGLTFGDGPNRQLVLPVQLSTPGIVLRQFAIGLPPGADATSGRIDVTFSIAGNLASVFAAEVDDAGLTISWTGGAGAAIAVEFKPPSAAGLRVGTSLLTGGGFLSYNRTTKEYGGVLDLQFTTIGITAIGLIGTDPFSLVIVIGVHFLPKIELSFGFTLSGVGGLLAIERRLDSDQLRAGIDQGIVSTLLFPEDPVAAAPQILQQLAAVFPPQSGGFVVGPMVELGWGSQAGFVIARLGVILSLPDPRIVVLGSLRIGVPSADIDPSLRIVDLRADVYGEITPDYFLVIVSLAGSKIAEITVTGDIGLLIRWGGGAAFAMSVGGFYPKYVPPPELAGLERLAMQLAPPVSFLKVRAQAYFAVTANSLQFGGGLWFSADLDVVSGEAWLTVDALFEWAPRIYFIFTIDCGVTIKAFGESVAGVTFRGTLSGTRPWHLDGVAETRILAWKATLSIPATEWGARDTSTPDAVSPAALVRAALDKDAAWKPQLPAGADAWVRLVEDRATPLLVHPLGALAVTQLSVPLETQIDRIGSNPVTSRHVNLADPTLGGIVAAAVSHAIDKFAPSQFFERKGDQAASGPDFEEYPCGMHIVASKDALHGDASAVEYAWNTVYPHQDFAPEKVPWNLVASLSAARALRNGAVSRAAQSRANPYAPAASDQIVVGPRPVASSGAAIRDEGLVQIAQRADLALRQGGQTMTYTSAQRLADASHRAGSPAALAIVAAGVAA
jgi:hypothetical protein